MPRCCSVRGCRSNKKSGPGRSSTFSLPRDEELRQQWVKNIPCDISGIKNPSVCGNHFRKEDIITVDRVFYFGEMREYPRMRPKLKENAVPTIFSNNTSYFATNRSRVKTLPIVETENSKKEITENILDRKAYKNKICITSLKDIQHHLKEKRKFPNENCSYSVSKEDISIIIVNNKQNVPAHSIVIQKNLEFNVFNENIEIKNKITNVQIINDTNVLDDIIDTVILTNFYGLSVKFTDVH